MSSTMTTSCKGSMHYSMTVHVYICGETVNNMLQKRVKGFSDYTKTDQGYKLAFNPLRQGLAT